MNHLANKIAILNNLAILNGTFSSVEIFVAGCKDNCNPLWRHNSELVES